MRSDWIVRTYDSFENQIYQWVIRNRYEHEAKAEAGESVEVRESHDWSIAKVRTVEDQENQDENLYKIISVLQQSDCVWTKYGSDTIVGLATKILNKIKGEN